MHESEKWKWSCSVVSYSLWPHGLQPTRLLRPWNFPGKSTGMGWQYGSLSLSLSRLWSRWLDWLVFCDCGFSVCPLMPSQCLLSYLGFSYLGCGVSLHGCSSKAQLLLLTSDMGYLLTATTPDLGHGVSWYVAFYPASFIYQVFKIHQILIQQRSHLGSNHTPGMQVARLVPITLKKTIANLLTYLMVHFTVYLFLSFW